MNEQLQREYAAFINNMDVRLGAFVLADLPESVEQEDGPPARFPKDFSPESLRLVEHFVLSKFASVDDAIAEENRRFTEGLLRYLGETYLRAIGGVWDHDSENGNGMPFIRPDTLEGPARGEPIPLIAVILTAVDQRTGTIFGSVLDKAREGLGPEGTPMRRSTGLSLGMLNAENSSQEEVDFLSRFIGTVEPGIAAWTRDQADPASWVFERESLERLGRQLAVRYDEPEEMMSEEEVPFVGGAMRFIGEILRRHGLGRWRYGADVEADDPRHKQPFVRFVIGDQNLDIVPWKLARTALDDKNALVEAFDTLIDLRTQEAEAAGAEGADGTEGTGAAAEGAAAGGADGAE